jgi:hypothetical protein
MPGILKEHPVASRFPMNEVFYVEHSHKFGGRRR